MKYDAARFSKIDKLSGYSMTSLNVFILGKKLYVYILNSINLILEAVNLILKAVNLILKAVNLNLKRELEKYLMDCKVNIISNVRFTTEPF